MNGTLLIVLVLVLGIGGLVAVAYFLDRRAKKLDPVGTKLPEPGPVGHVLLWIVRILVVLMVLSMIGAFVYRSLLLAWVTAGCLALYLIIGTIYRIVLFSNK